jgi:hypothetical protein
MEAVPMGDLASNPLVYLLTLSLGLNVTWIILLARGILATRAQLDAVQKMADTFQKAWEVSESKGEVQTDTLNRLLTTSDTVLRILEARPPIMHTPGEHIREGGPDVVVE